MLASGIQQRSYGRWPTTAVNSHISTSTFLAAPAFPCRFGYQWDCGLSRGLKD